jgi:hypothetical protein
MSDGIVLRSLNGANPLAYLAALGSQRLLELAGAGHPKLRWVRRNGWRPEITGTGLGEEELCEALLHAPAAPPDGLQQLGKNITVPPVVFRIFVEAAQSGATLGDRRFADFAGCFGCEVCKDRRLDRIQVTQLCFITGSGHQDFLETMVKLQVQVRQEHLANALFGEWRYSDPGLSFGWDPADAREYALRWRDPGPEGASTVWGANRLAFEALPLFPAQPMGRDLGTTGMKDDALTWPIWDGELSSDIVRSVLALGELRKVAPNHRELTEVGVVETYRAQRVRIGSGANFKVRFRPARAV